MEQLAAARVIATLGSTIVFTGGTGEHGVVVRATTARYFDLTGVYHCLGFALAGVRTRQQGDCCFNGETAST